MYKKFRIFSMLGLMMVISSCETCQKTQEAKNSASIDFARHYSMKPSFDHENNLFTIDISLDDQIHSYADGEKIGKPMRLEISPKNGWEAEGTAEVPQGKTKDLGELGHSMVVEGAFTIKQKVKKGTGPGEAVLHLQVCTTNLCDRPRVHRFMIE